MARLGQLARLTSAVMRRTIVFTIAALLVVAVATIMFTTPGDAWGDRHKKRCHGCTEQVTTTTVKKDCKTTTTTTVPETTTTSIHIDTTTTTVPVTTTTTPETTTTTVPETTTTSTTDPTTTSTTSTTINTSTTTTTVPVTIPPPYRRRHPDTGANTKALIGISLVMIVAGLALLVRMQRRATS